MFVEALILNIIYILFPILLFLSYFTYQETFQKKINNLFFDLSILTSFYLLSKYGLFSKELYNILLANSLLVLSFYKERKILSYGMMISMIIILHTFYNFNIYFLIIQFALFIVTYTYLLKSNKKEYINLTFNVFSILPVLLSIKTSEYIYLMIYIIIIYLISCLLIKIITKSEELISLNATIKRLEKEKLLRNSLFKVTHEIKNPIAVCKGYLDMLDTNNTKQVNKYIAIIKGEINRTLNIMTDFLDLTKLKIKTGILDIILLIEDTCSCSLALAKDKKVKFICDIPEEEILIEGDYERLKQVLINIIKNSIEALEDVKEPIIHMKAKKAKNYIYIEIKDNGIGMDKITLEKIGEAFFTTKTKGTGLGIKLSKEIIEAHDGRIDFESKEGVGTTVNIRLKIK